MSEFLRIEAILKGIPTGIHTTERPAVELGDAIGNSDNQVRTHNSGVDRKWHDGLRWAGAPEKIIARWTRDQKADVPRHSCRVQSASGEARYEVNPDTRFCPPVHQAGGGTGVRHHPASEAEHLQPRSRSDRTVPRERPMGSVMPSSAAPGRATARFYARHATRFLGGLGRGRPLVWCRA
jgi:hypothetical protein